MRVIISPMNLSFAHGLKWTALVPVILAACTLPAREPDFSKAKSVLQEAVNDGAVSYTHLTLPTNREV